MKSKSPLGRGDSIKAKANRREKKLAVNLGGYRQPNSGALITHKGDIVTEKFLFDSKHTEKKSHSITVDVLEKITKEAREQNKHPALIISLEHTPFSVPTNWVVLPQEIFQELLKVYEDKAST